MNTAILKMELVSDRRISIFFGIVIFTVLTMLGAFVRIPLPFTPVPLTLQTFFVLLSGAFLGSFGALSQLGYVILGITGLPIFANAGSGFGYLLGPTGGYLFGFIAAALFTGKSLRYHKRGFWYTLSVMYAADLIILGSGAIWMKMLFGYSADKILFMAFWAFVPADLIKAGVAAVIYERLKNRIREIL